MEPILLEKSDEQVLLRTAKQSIAQGLETKKPLAVDVQSYCEALQQEKATFVTLEKKHALRGCIGTLRAHLPLIRDVAEHSFAAAFGDPRFPPVQQGELDSLSIHITVLTAPSPLSFSSEEDLLSQIRPQKDGLILSDGGYGGTFLPSVWESLPDPRDFLSHLKNKAGLPSNYWSRTIQVQRYSAQAFLAADWNAINHED